MHAVDELEASIERSGSIACVGLDPRPSLLPPSIVERFWGRTGDRAVDVAAAFVDANRRIIDAVAPHCAAVKPQAACYEAYGVAGWQALADTIAHARAAGLPVILDAKRGDIGSTAEHYGQMAFGGAPDLDGSPTAGIGASWMTVNPYMGADGVIPVLDVDPGRGVFVLVKTSNPSSVDLQDRKDLDGATVADQAAALVTEWGRDRIGECGLSDVGAVVGATQPADARRLRAAMPDAVFLIPGYGAQGAGAADALAGQRSDGRGVIVSSSRGITGAWRATGTDDLASAALGALRAMNDDLAEHRR